MNLGEKILSVLFAALLVCNMLFVSAETPENSTNEPGQPQDIQSENCHSMIQKWFSSDNIDLFSDTDPAIKQVIEEYFDFRLQSVFTLKNEVPNCISDNVLNTEKMRKIGLDTFWKSLNIKVTDADHNIRIDKVEKAPNGTYTAYAYEWTFYDYDDLDTEGTVINVSGFGVEHIILIQNADGEPTIIEDKYDESDRSGICTIETVEDNLNQETTEDSEENTSLFSTNFYKDYNVKAAIEYADKYAINYNPAYYNFNNIGGDCANYVSQCISAGGMPQVVCSQYGTSGWFYKTSSNRSATWTGAPQLRTWMANNRGVLISKPSSSQMYAGSPFFTNDGGHALICVGKNAEGSPIYSAHNNDAYREKIYLPGVNYTVQLTPSNDYQNDITYKEISADTYRLENNGSYLTATADDNTTVLVIKSKTGENNQRFTASPNNRFSKSYALKSLASSSGRVLNVFTDGVSANGDNVTLYSSTTDASQTWRFEEKGGGYLIHPVDNSELALTNSNGVAKVLTSTGTSNQIWKLVSAIDQYIVSYNANGGSGAPGNQTKYHDQALTLSSVKPVRAGYTFQGWADSANGSVRFAPGSGYTSNSNITLYAVWKANQYTVSYNANGGSGAPGNQTKYHDQALTLSSVKPVRTGYTFQGWADSANGSVRFAPGSSYTSNSDITLYAVWKADQYTVLYNANGGSGAPESQTKYPGKNLTLSDVQPVRDGYKFMGWSSSSSAQSVQYAPGALYTTDSNLTLYAVWAKIYYIKYDANGGSNAPFATQKIHGKSVELSMVKPIRTGYIFGGWSTTPTGKIQYQPGDTYTEDKNLTLYAVWTKEVYTIKWDLNGGTAGESFNDTSYGAYEVPIIFPYNPVRPGYHFLGWRESKDSGVIFSYYDGSGELVYTHNTTMYAIWQKSNAQKGMSEYYIQEGANGTGTKDNPVGGLDEVVWALGGKDATVYICGTVHMDGWGDRESKWNVTITLTGADKNARLTLKKNTMSVLYGNIVFKNIQFDHVENVFSNWNFNGGKTVFDSGSDWNDIVHAGMVSASQADETKSAKVDNSYFVMNSGYIRTLFLCGAYSSTYDNTISEDNTFVMNGGKIDRLFPVADTYLDSHKGITIEGNFNIMLNSGTITNIFMPSKYQPIVKGAVQIICNNGLKTVTNDTYVVIRDTILPEKGSYMIYSGEGGMVETTSIAGVFKLIPDSGNCAVINGKSYSAGIVKLSQGITTVTWEKEPAVRYTVSYDANGGTGIPWNQTKYHDQDLTLSFVEPMRNGYAFKGWATEKNGTVVYQPEDSYSRNENVTLYAVWEVIPITGITLDKTSVTLGVGEETTLKVTIIPRNAAFSNEIVVRSSDPEIAEVRFENDDEIIVKAVAAGTATVTVENFSGSVKATCTVSITHTHNYTGTYYESVHPHNVYSKCSCGAIRCTGETQTVASCVSCFPVTAVSLNKSSATLSKGETLTLTATVSPSNAANKAVTWTSSDSSVVTVSNGVVTAVGKGTATVTVKTTDGGKTAFCTVTVTETVTNAKANFTLSSVSGRPGDAVKVKLHFKSEEKINSIAVFGISYNKDVLAFEGFEDYQHLEEMTILPPSFDEEKMAIVIGLKSSVAFDGDLCTLNFKIKEDAAEGSYDVTADSTVKMKSTQISSAVHSGKITVYMQKTGDIDGNDTIDIDDAVLLFQYSMLPGLYPISYAGNLDFNKDGTIDIEDAVRLFQYSMLPDLYPLE